jgi:hypothetical protein
MKRGRKKERRQMRREAETEDREDRDITGKYGVRSTLYNDRMYEGVRTASVNR